MSAPARASSAFPIPAEVIDRDYLRGKLFHYFLEIIPRNDDELHFWIRHYAGYNIPRRKYCPHHESPFAFIADQFFERSQSVFGFANRSGGKTSGSAILNLVDGLFKPGIEIVLAGAVKFQADKGYELFAEIVAKEPLLGDPEIGQVPYVSRQIARFRNGSLIRMTAATWHGLNGHHPAKFRLDEVELLHINAINESKSMTLGKPIGRTVLLDGKPTDSWKAQDTYTSTRKLAGGTVQKILDDAPTNGTHVISWCIYEILERCTRQCKDDPVHGTCRAYSRVNKDGVAEMLCGGRAHDLPPGGWFPIGDFVKKVSDLDKQTYDAQWLNLRPWAGALVYGEYFKPEPPFVVLADEAALLLERMKREQKWPRVIGIDFGANFSVGYWAQDPKDLVWYNYFEIFWPPENDVPLLERAKVIMDKDPLGWSRRTHVFPDPSGKQAITDIQNFGIDCVPANNEHYGGIQHIKMLLQKRTPTGLPGLRVFYNCKRLIREMSEMYVHWADSKGEINPDKVLDRDNHACDQMRYALYSYATVGTSTYKLRKLRGVW